VTWPSFRRMTSHHGWWPAAGSAERKKITPISAIGAIARTKARWRGFNATPPGPVKGLA
jgi:hypothetical protein